MLSDLFSPKRVGVMVMISVLHFVLTLLVGWESFFRSMKWVDGLNETAEDKIVNLLADILSLPLVPMVVGFGETDFIAAFALSLYFLNSLIWGIVIVLSLAPFLEKWRP